jgi:hypothetical protein
VQEPGHRTGGVPDQAGGARRACAAPAHVADDEAPSAIAQGGSVTSVGLITDHGDRVIRIRTHHEVTDTVSEPEDAEAALGHRYGPA